MSQASAETARLVVENAYEVLSRRDVDEWLKSTTPDFSISDVPDLPGAAVYRGREEARRWAEVNLASLQEWNWAIEGILFNDGSTVVVRVLLTGRSTAGLPVELVVFHVFELSGNKLSAARGYFEKAQALESAGLPPQAQ